MNPKIINCISLSNSIKNNLKKSIARHTQVPGLAVILIGSRPDSKIYVNMKKRAAKDLNINFVLHEYSEDVSTDHILSEINSLNKNNDIHGIIVQLPLPIHLDEPKILSTISIHKDIDGLNPTNIGNLAMINRDPFFVPCTPKGALTVLDNMNIDLKGKHVVIIGKSNIVGMPMALLCMKRDATVSVCHIHTENIREITKMADILIVACGCPKMVKSDWIKDGVIILDVGITKVNNRLVGDVDMDDCISKVAGITSVPNGIGKMTVISLMENVYNSFLNNNI